MAAVVSRGQRFGRPIAILVILAVTLIFLSPILWIGATAFKPRSVATSVPPTVLFQPEVTPFVKLFTKRVQAKEKPTPEAYAAAPWWEKAILDGGERVLRVGDDVQLSQYPNRFLNRPDRLDRLDRAGRFDGYDHRLRFSRASRSRASRTSCSSSSPLACCRRWWSPSRCS